MTTADTYISKKKDGLPSKDDDDWIKTALDSLTNKQAALFKRWVNCFVPGMKTTKSRLIVLTPLRLLCIRKKKFGRSIHKIVRLMDFVVVDVNDQKSEKETLVTIDTCSFPADSSLTQSRQAKSLKTLQLQFYFVKDIDKEFLEMLQWCLYILTRGLPPRFEPKLNIPLSYRKKIEDTVMPVQYVVDRYVSSCDAQNANRNAGVAAFGSVVDFVLNLNNSDIFDLRTAFLVAKRSNHSNFGLSAT
ncbi:hypothetical protein RFI_03540 [Reticulomyxa filosa]|uniref:Uncharacterized protein n=1 Tax=Reticulomyxa filosa TaxID=46433 RepID=X6P7E9_RETFI|nr:hypothetical protein RFI_03540 [Reticulomyxa filosa]|eukprot:ETO33562.1 hypothetical protein RFI_03540 [Reticulomyxa filosa]